MDREPSEADPRLIAKELQLAVSSTQRTLYFHGESMRPFLVEGDEVVVEPVAWDTIRLGDVITYRYLDRFPTRRVIRKNATEVVLWCDNWPDRIFTAPKEDVLGRAIARRRGESWLRDSTVRWQLARISAIIRWEIFRFRSDGLKETLARARRAPGKLLRITGLLPPPGRK